MKTRIISAAVLFSICAGCVCLSRVTRVLFFAFSGILCLYELFENYRKKDIICAAWPSYLFILAEAVLALLNAGEAAGIACAFFVLFVIMFRGIVNPKIGGPGVVFSLATLAYPGFSVVLMCGVCATDKWIPTALVGCLSCWCCDTFALLGGTRFGKHKLAPHISPNKSIEGCICGAVSSLVCGVLLCFLLKPLYPLPMWLCVLTALLASTMGQLGDLAESMLKRYLGVKDSSNLIPGHGGMLDRADALLFGIPTAYFCIHIYELLIG